jgi:uncharacterized DUF497 family protein
MSRPISILWSDDPEENVVEHVRDHGIEPDEADEVITAYFDQREPSRAGTGRWVVQGYTTKGRYLIVVFDHYVDADLVVPVTAYEPTKEA